MDPTTEEMLNNGLQVLSFPLEAIGFSLAVLDAFSPRLRGWIENRMRRYNSDNPWIRGDGAELAKVTVSSTLAGAGSILGSTLALGLLAAAYEALFGKIGEAHWLIAVAGGGMLLGAALGLVLLSLGSLYRSLSAATSRPVAAVGFLIAAAGLGLESYQFAGAVKWGVARLIG